MVKGRPDGIGISRDRNDNGISSDRATMRRSTRRLPATKPLATATKAVVAGSNGSSSFPSCYFISQAEAAGKRSSVKAASDVLRCTRWRHVSQSGKGVSFVAIFCFHPLHSN
ncbi:hypothetical protein MRX96_054241 [Rhipicephalus microplus]